MLRANQPRAGNTLPAHVVGISSKALIFESVKVRLDFQTDHAGRGVGQIVLFDVFIHDGCSKGVGDGEWRAKRGQSGCKTMIEG
jgi:hypothetical protein